MNPENDHLRRPLLGDAHRFVSAPDPNPVAKRWAASIGDAFSESIFPDLDPLAPFEASQAPRYVSVRSGPEIVGNGEIAEGPHAFETQLHEKFWRDPGPTLIFIEGEVGCGKSTFVEYYLRSFCPQSERGHLFEEKLRVNIDFRSTSSSDEFDKLYYSETRKSIELACTRKKFDIESADNYDMWNDVYKWDSQAARDAQGALSDAQYRGSVVMANRLLATDKTWVDSALTYLSRVRDRKGSPYKYLVFCLDNLDQSTLEVQRYAIETTIRRLKQTTITVWRIIIPVWPSTLAGLKDAFDPMPANDVINLGPVDNRKLLQFRTSFLYQRILAESKIDVELTAFDKEYLTACLDHAQQSFFDDVSQLAGGSARRQLYLWRVTLSSNSLYQHYQHNRKTLTSARRSPFTSYVMMDALLTGEYRLFNSKHTVLNLFNILGTVRDERDVLIGIHLLTLLKSIYRNFGAIVETMTRLGYEAADVNRAMERLKTAGFFEVDSERFPKPIVIRKSVLLGYDSLLEAPAYMDNMALACPAHPKALKDMKYTTSYFPTEFAARCRTTLLFLSQIALDEQRFCDPASSRRVKLDRFHFGETLKLLGLPRYSKKLVAAYEDRLKVLKKGPFLFHLSDTHWEEILSEQIFVDAESASAELRPDTE